MKKLIITALAAALVFSSSIPVFAAQKEELTYYCTAHEKYDTCPYDGICPYGNEECVNNGECTHSEEQNTCSLHNNCDGNHRKNCARTQSSTSSGRHGNGNGGHHGGRHH